MTDFDFDVLVVGSASALGDRAAADQKGYRVGVLEAGARFEDDDFSKGTTDVKKYLWAPALGMYGIQRIDAVRDTMIVAGAGVGGGSLVYANTLYEPLPAFYNDPQWSHITDWKSELAPYYDPGQADARCRRVPVPYAGRRRDGEGRPATWAWATRSTRPRSASSSAAWPASGRGGGRPVLRRRRPPTGVPASTAASA
jgi:hypothetical protein